MLKKIFFILYFFFSFSLGAETQVEKVPLGYPLEYPMQFLITKSGIDYLAEQINYGLESSGLKKKIVDALEGLTFQTYMPIIGGTLTFTILGAGDDSYDGVRYNKTEFALFTTPPPFLNKNAESDEMYPVLTVTADAEGNHPEIDLKIEHQFFTIDKVTVQADLRIAGVFHIITANDSLSVDSKDYEAELLYLYVPYVQLPEIPGMPNNLQHKVEKAFNDYLTQAVKEFFEKNIDKALAGAIKDTLDILLFDKNGDGVPDTLLNLNEILITANDFLGAHFKNNLHFGLEVFSDPPSVVINGRGALYSDYVSSSVQFPQQWFYRTILENDGCYGEDPPYFPATLPDNSSYMTAFSISDDFLNQLILSLYNEGFFNFSLDTSQITNVPDKYKDYMTTKSFSLLGMNDFYNYFPNSYLRITLRTLKPPYIRFNKTNQITIYLPEAEISIFADSKQNFYKLFTVNGLLRMDLELTQINLSGAPRMVFTLTPFANMKVIYNEIAPEYNNVITQSLIPFSMAVVSQSISDYFQKFPLPLTECIQGATVEDFKTLNEGENEDKNMNYFIGLINLSGIIDLDKFLNQCLNVENFSLPVSEIHIGTSPPTAKIYRVNGSVWMKRENGKWWETLPPGTYRIEIIRNGKIEGFSYSKKLSFITKKEISRNKSDGEKEGCTQSGSIPLILIILYLIFLKIFVKVRG